MKTVGVVVVHFGNWELTQRCVKSVEGSAYRDFQIEVVDNDTINRGFAGGANVGIRKALLNSRVEWVLVLNNDTRLEKAALEAMIRTAEDSGTDMVAPWVCQEKSGEVDRLGIVLGKSYLGFNMTRDDAGEPMCPSGCAALYSRRLLEAVAQGGQYFDEDFFMYDEDADLGWRASRLGFRCCLAREAVVHHMGSASSYPRADLPLYLGHRNNVWRIVKNVPRGQFVRHLPWIAAGQAASLLWLTFQGKGRLIWRAKRDALAGLPLMWRKRRLMGARARHNLES